MNWLARLKKIDADPIAGAAEPTKPVQEMGNRGFVGFVAPYLEPKQKTEAELHAANDGAPDPDRWCWPLSEAMNTAEIDTFMARLARFTDKGLSLDMAEALADKLVKRDREKDDRRLCLECVHLAGHAAGMWGCRNWRKAGVATNARDAQLSAALVNQPQRCDGFKDKNPQGTTP